MLHPSYGDMIEALNTDVQEGEAPIVNSRYSVVLATAKRARQIISGAQPRVECAVNKPLSIAVQEIYHGKVKIVNDEEETAATPKK
ncbi:MAG: DNA-directed RNA polymerase subunit omega [Lachnospiraceae bacterium]|nr:DNA-directed RNA polymerase subunit omega [Lachnospiraceae bacterium]